MTNCDIEQIKKAILDEVAELVKTPSDWFSSHNVRHNIFHNSFKYELRCEDPNLLSPSSPWAVFIEDTERGEYRFVAKAPTCNIPGLHDLAVSLEKKRVQRNKGAECERLTKLFVGKQKKKSVFSRVWNYIKRIDE